MKPTGNDLKKTETTEANSLKIIWRLIEELSPSPANPRLHSKKQVRQIANSIRTFGFNVPILTDRDGEMVGGSHAASSGLPKYRRCASIT